MNGKKNALVRVTMEFENGRVQQLEGADAQAWLAKVNAAYNFKSVQTGFMVAPDPWKTLVEGEEVPR